MTKSISYSEARANLAKIWDEVIDNQDIMLLKRRGKDDVALIAADELSSLLESIHLLRSPKNAKRLLTALNRAKTRSGKKESLSDFKNSLFCEEL